MSMNKTVTSARRRWWMHTRTWAWSLSALLGPVWTLCPGVAHADPPVPVTFTGQSHPVTPFGYGPVQEVFASDASSVRTGQEMCRQAFDATWNCLSVSGATGVQPVGSAPDIPHSCGAAVPAGELVTCNQGSSPDAPISDPAFAQPTSCDPAQLDTNEMSWCQGTGGTGTTWPEGYMGHRTQDVIYQYSDYVRVGMNRKFGGAIFELYGANKINLVEQDGGAAMQMSFWGYDANQSSLPWAWFGVLSNPSDSCDATPYPTQAACQAVHSSCTSAPVGKTVSDCKTTLPCAPWATVASPFNPIQAQGVDCGGGPTMRIDSVTNPAPGEIMMSKTNPNNFTKTSVYEGMTWTQTTSVKGPFLQVTYHVTQEGGFSGGPTGQEFPAFWTRDGGIGTTFYYYGGATPYEDATSPLSKLTVLPDSSGVQLAVFTFPDRSSPKNEDQPAYDLSEEWVSTCNAAGDVCLTVASFSDQEKERQAYRAGQNHIFTGWGTFALAPGLDLTKTEYYFPYRFDDVVLGLTIRQWIYALKTGAPLPAGAVGEVADAGALAMDAPDATASPRAMPQAGLPAMTPASSAAGAETTEGGCSTTAGGRRGAGGGLEYFAAASFLAAITWVRRRDRRKSAARISLCAGALVAAAHLQGCSSDGDPASDAAGHGDGGSEAGVGAPGQAVPGSSARSGTRGHRPRRHVLERRAGSRR